ncbi:MAG: FtsQ-type POTRA domain-containing protein [Propionibacteriaceae bacterium]|nr:FtsQ-type POTRA domain-containing protein [Propionibacteriaceae bacterium]
MSPGRVTDATGRLELRARRDSRSRLLRALVVVLVVAVAGGLVYLVAFSPVLAAKAVAVTGTKVLTKQDVLAAAAVDVGTPLARVDTDAVAGRVAGLPPVAQVTVVRSWPDTLQIAVIERKARLAIPASSGYLIADASGVVFEAAASAPSSLVLVDAPATNRELLADVGTVYSALSADTAAKVSRVEAETTDSIVLRLSDGSRVVWGSAEQSQLKSRVLDDLLPLGGQVFDVSAPAFPTRR